MSHSSQAKPFRSFPAVGNARRRFTPSVLVLALSSALALPGTAFAVDWVGSFSSIWMDDANWNTAIAPTAGQNANIDTTAGQVVTVDGTNAVAAAVAIGTIAGGTGAVNITTAGILTTSFGMLGTAQNATGTMTVSGAGAIWGNGGAIVIGNAGTGTLDISAGGVVNNSGDTTIGQLAAAAGTATVGGAGSQLLSSGNLTVGDAGTGVLTIINGGAVSNAGGFIGNLAGSTGTVNVDGTGQGATWTSTQSLTVGNAGTGVLNVTNGGVVTSTAGIIGGASGSNGTVTVDNSTWTSTGVLVVGNGGTGSLNILNGAVVTNTNGFVGETAGISGTVTVDGTGSTWTNNGALSVGDGGTGTVNVTAGGTLGSNGAGIGMAPGATGNVTIDGTGSQWTALGNIAIGNGGTGTLTIKNDGAVAAAGAVALGESAGVSGTLAISGGGSLTGASLFVGDAAGSSGVATIDGAGSNFQTTGILVVGNGGTGMLTISNDGSASNTGDGIVGSVGGSHGAVLVTGANSQWITGGNLSVGSFGTGVLTLANGGTASASAATLGAAAGSSGTMNVNGTGSAFTATGSLNVGSNGTGVMNVFGGGIVSNAAGFVGQGAGSSGAATVSGAGSTWTNTGDLLVGEFGTGTLAIQSGGVVNNVDGTIGSSAGSTGTVTVSGANSAWHNSGGLTVGDLGAGTLVISNGGVVTSDRGAVDGTAGVVTVDGVGSLWDNNTNLFVGNTNAGTGTLNISNGGAVLTNLASVASTAGATGSMMLVNGGTLGSNLGIIGDAAGTNGAVTVIGAGSAWTNTGDLTIGSSGTGALTIKNGGVVSNFNGVLGENTGAIGAATVDGAGSVWNIGGSLAIGGAGTGLLIVANGGVASSAFVSVGAGAGSTGTLTVTGVGSALNATGAQVIVVGADGTGRLNIFNGGTVATDLATIGQNTGSVGDVKVVGAGSVWNNTGTLTIADIGTGTLTIANDGIVNVGGLVTLGNQGVGTLNIGNPAGVQPGAPGKLNAANIVIGVRSGTINFNHTDTSGNYTFDAAVSGPGVINQLAGLTKMTADSNGFDGIVNVNGGRLAVNGSLANGTMIVNNGGNLGGSGTVGLTFVNTGGMVSPGNSIGTLNVNGNITFATGSTYQVEVDPAGNADKIIASGTATLDGGTVQVIAGTGSYAPLTSYDILTAQGGVTGKFDGVTSNFAFLDPSLSYAAKGVSLTLTRNNKGFANVGLTPNQKAAGTGTEGLGSGNVIYDAVLGLSVDQARNSFDQLSGEIHPAARGVQLEDSRFVRDASLERLRALDSERVANDGGADPQEGKPARLLASVRDLAYWAHAMGSWGHADGDGNAATVKRDTSGFLMGADSRFGDEGRFGLVGGYSRSAFDVTDRNSSGSSDNYHLGAYAGSRWGDLALRTGLAYSWHDVSTTRGVSFPGFRDSLKADYKANTTQAFAELGYRIKTEKVELEPFASLASVNVSSDAFAERGGAAALSSSGGSNGVTFSTLGLRANSSFSLAGGASVSARGSLGWRNTLGDVTPTTGLAFAGGTPFVVAGVPIAKSAAVVEAGLDFKLSNAATLGLSYSGQFGSGLKDHSARVNLNVAF